MSNKDTVLGIYESFNRGDIPAIIEQLDEDVNWEQWKDNFAQKADIPYLRSQTGKKGVADFFVAVEDLGVKKIDILSVLEGGNQIAVELELESAKFEDEEIHLWTFNDEGKVTRFRHYIDTAKQIAANEKSKTSTAA
ncbi:MAG: nuclear transport factor 2 family protein [Pyrinomonadaceae bacterium]